MQNIHEISTSKFTWLKERQEFVAELSELRMPMPNLLSKVYDDACDLGFYMVSEKTGKKALFVLYEYDDESDVMTWKFTCAEEGLGHIGLTIFND